MAFLLAPWPLTVAYITLFTYTNIGKLIIVVIFTPLFVCYANLIILGIPLCFILRKYNFLKFAHTLWIAVAIGFIEGALLSIIGMGFEMVIPFGLFFAFNSLVVACSLIFFLKLFEES